MKQFLSILVCALALCGCAASRHSSVNKVAPIEGYKYFYVLGTNEMVSIDSRVGLADELGNASANTYINAFNPSDVIIGYLMKKGCFKRLFTVFPIFCRNHRNIGRRLERNHIARLVFCH